MKLAVFLLAAYGLSLALTLLHVGKPYRWLGEKIGLKILVNCPSCTAFWIGILISIFWASPAAAVAKGSWTPIPHALDGLAASGVTWIIHVALTKMGQHEL